MKLRLAAGLLVFCLNVAIGLAQPQVLYENPCVPGGWETTQNYYGRVAYLQNAAPPPAALFPFVSHVDLPGVMRVHIIQGQDTYPQFIKGIIFNNGWILDSNLDVSSLSMSQPSYFNDLVETNGYLYGSSYFSWSATVTATIRVGHIDPLPEGGFYTWNETFTDSFSYQEYTPWLAAIYVIVDPSQFE